MSQPAETTVAAELITARPRDQEVIRKLACTGPTKIDIKET